MKKVITAIASVALSLSIVAPAFAWVETVGQERLSRRLVRSQAYSQQRIITTPAMPVELLLRQRKEAQTDATGLSRLGRARYRTIKGQEMNNTRLGFPTRRTLRQNTEESMLVLPPAIVQTGGEEVTFEKLSRRSIVERARWMNGFLPQ